MLFLPLKLALDDCSGMLFLPLKLPHRWPLMDAVFASETSTLMTASRLLVTVPQHCQHPHHHCPAATSTWVQTAFEFHSGEGESDSTASARTYSRSHRSRAGYRFIRLWFAKSPIDLIICAPRLLPPSRLAVFKLCTISLQPQVLKPVLQLISVIE